MTIFQTTMYVHDCEGIFRVYPALDAEKPLIFAWAAAPILEWPRNPKSPWDLTKIASKWKSGA